MGEGPKGDAEGEGVVGLGQVGRQGAAGDGMDVGRVGAQGDAVGKHRAGPLGGRAGEIGKPQHEAVEADGPAGVADVRQLGEAMAGAEHGRGQGDAARIDALGSLAAKPLVPGKRAVLRRGERLEVETSLPVGRLGRRVGPRREEVAKGIVVAPFAVPGRIAPVLERDISRRRRPPAAETAIRPDFVPGVGLVPVGTVAEFGRLQGPVGLSHRFGVELLGEAEDGRLPTRVEAFQGPVGMLGALEVGVARQGEHFAPLGGVEEHGAARLGGLEPDRTLREPW